MKTYIGTKLIQARPMTRAAYNEYRGWNLPQNENGSDEGYLVEYLDGGKSNDPRHLGYISWSQADVFATAYREISGLTFGEALEALKRGERIARAGWNGKGMWLSLSGDGVRHIPAAQFWSRHNADFAASCPDGTAPVLPCITMKTADGSILMGWLASQTDMLAEDWQLVD